MEEAEDKIVTVTEELTREKHSEIMSAGYRLQSAQ